MEEQETDFAPLLDHLGGTEGLWDAAQHLGKALRALALQERAEGMEDTYRAFDGIYWLKEAIEETIELNTTWK